MARLDWKYKTGSIVHLSDENGSVIDAAVYAVVVICPGYIAVLIVDARRVAA